MQSSITASSLRAKDLVNNGHDLLIKKRSKEKYCMLPEGGKVLATTLLHRTNNSCLVLVILLFLTKVEWP